MRSAFIQALTGAHAVADKLHVDRRLWGDEYIGPTGLFLSAGLIEAGMVPDCPIGKTRTTSYYKGVRRKNGPSRDEDWLRISRKVTPDTDTLTVWLGISEEERKRREADWEKDRAAKYDKARQEAYRDFYSQPEELRTFVLQCLRILRNTIAQNTPGDHERGTTKFLCRFDPEGLDDVFSSMEDVEEWISENQISSVDKAVLRHLEARDDSAFQAFLRAQCIGGEG